MATKQLSELRDHLEIILSLPSGDAYVDSAAQLDDIQDGYNATALAYEFPQLLLRRGVTVTSNVDRYSLPTGFRKARMVKVLGVPYKEVELDVLKDTPDSFAIDMETSELVLSRVPASSSTAYTLQNAESAAAAVTIELDTVSGLAQLDEIWIDSAAGTDEFSLVSDVDSTNTTITARLRAAKSASDIIYRVKEIIDIQLYRTVPTLANSTDTLLLPDPLDFVVCNYAAFKAYTRLEEYDRAKGQFDLWKQQVDAYWLAHSRTSTGEAAQFSI